MASDLCEALPCRLTSSPRLLEQRIECDLSGRINPYWLGGFFANDFAKLFQIRVFSEYLISNFWRYQF